MMQGIFFNHLRHFLPRGHATKSCCDRVDESHCTYIQVKKGRVGKLVHLNMELYIATLPPCSREEAVHATLHYLIMPSIDFVIVSRFAGAGAAAAAYFWIEKFPPKLNRTNPAPEGLAELGHPRRRSRRRCWTKAVDDVRGDDRGRRRRILLRPELI